MRKKRPHEMMRQLMDQTEKLGWSELDRMWLCGHERWPTRSIGYARVHRAMRLFEMWSYIMGKEREMMSMIDDIKSEMWDKRKHIGLSMFKVNGIRTMVNDEGPHVGRQIVEVRTSGCNLSCNGCNRERMEEGVMMSSNMVRRAIHSIWAGEDLLTIRGGEPLLWQENMGFLEMMFDWRFVGRSVHVETNGSVIPNFLVREMVESFVVKPRGRREEKVWFALLKRWERLKPFYKLSASDAEEVKWCATVLLPKVERKRIWVVPRGGDEVQVQQSVEKISEVVEEEGMHLSINRRFSDEVVR